MVIETPPRAIPDEETRTRPRRQPPYAVVLHNDDLNGFDYVIEVLGKVFGYGRWKAFWSTLTAHGSGRSVVWSGARQVAELKAEQIRGCGPDPRKVSAGARPLSATVAPLPGE